MKPFHRSLLLLLLFTAAYSGLYFFFRADMKNFTLHAEESYGLSASSLYDQFNLAVSICWGLFFFLPIFGRRFIGQGKTQTRWLFVLQALGLAIVFFDPMLGGVFLRLNASGKSGPAREITCTVLGSLPSQQRIWYSGCPDLADVFVRADLGRFPGLKAGDQMKITLKAGNFAEYIAGQERVK